MKEKQVHPYFWLVGAGGPGNYRRRTRAEEQVRKMLIGVKARAKELGISFNLSLDDVIIPEKCPVFGNAFIRGNCKGTKHGGNPRSPTIDRIVPTKGYIKGNVCIVSMKANDIKETSSLKELEDRLRNEEEHLANLRKVVRFYQKINKNGRG